MRPLRLGVALINTIGVLRIKQTQRMCTASKDHVGHRRRQSPWSQGERPQEKPNHQHLGLEPPEWGEIRFCCLSHQVWGILPRQPQQVNPYVIFLFIRLTIYGLCLQFKDRFHEGDDLYGVLFLFIFLLSPSKNSFHYEIKCHLKMCVKLIRRA